MSTDYRGLWPAPANHTRSPSRKETQEAESFSLSDSLLGRSNVVRNRISQSQLSSLILKPFVLISSGIILFIIIVGLVVNKKPILPPPSAICKGGEIYAVQNPLKTGSKVNFRNKLIPGQRYITTQTDTLDSFLGFTNQFQTNINLLYLALKTQRVAILPILQPVHISPPSYPTFSEFFDLPRFQRLTGVPVIEWSDIKAPSKEDEFERIACWSSLEGMYRLHFQQYHLHGPPIEYPPIQSDDLAFPYLTISPVHWPMPEHMRGHDSNYMSFDSIIAFDQDPKFKEQWLETLINGITYQSSVSSNPYSPLTNRSIPIENDRSIRPDENILCLQDTFYLKASPFSPSPYYPKQMLGPQWIYSTYGIADHYMSSWYTIGQYLHWSPAVDAKADDLLRMTFQELLNKPRGRLKARQSSSFADIPPYISIHIRNGDFGSNRNLNLYHEKVAWVRNELNRQEHGRWKNKANQLLVVVATDVPGDALKKYIKQEGWFLVDHTKFDTMKKFGGWYPAILDACILGRSEGFVGTHRSTYSIYSWLRTETWQGGVGTEVNEEGEVIMGVAFSSAHDLLYNPTCKTYEELMITNHLGAAVLILGFGLLAFVVEAFIVLAIISYCADELHQQGIPMFLWRITGRCLFKRRPDVEGGATKPPYQPDIRNLKSGPNYPFMHTSNPYAVGKPLLNFRNLQAVSSPDNRPLSIEPESIQREPEENVFNQPLAKLQAAARIDHDDDLHIAMFSTPTKGKLPEAAAKKSKKVLETSTVRKTRRRPGTGIQDPVSKTNYGVVADLIDSYSTDQSDSKSPLLKKQARKQEMFKMPKSDGKRKRGPDW